MQYCKGGTLVTATFAASAGLWRSLQGEIRRLFKGMTDLNHPRLVVMPPDNLHADGQALVKTNGHGENRVAGNVEPNGPHRRPYRFLFERRRFQRCRQGAV